MLNLTALVVIGVFGNQDISQFFIHLHGLAHAFPGVLGEEFFGFTGIFFVQSQRLFVNLLLLTKEAALQGIAQFMQVLDRILPPEVEQVVDKIDGPAG